MGNCIPRSCQVTHTADQGLKSHEQEKNGNMMRIKVVLTKEELEWLMLELKNTHGMKIEDLLGEIQSNRSRERSCYSGQGWKPSLDSISENPELQEGMQAIS